MHLGMHLLWELIQQNWGSLHKPCRLAIWAEDKEFQRLNAIHNGCGCFRRSNLRVIWIIWKFTPNHRYSWINDLISPLNHTLKWWGKERRERERGYMCERVLHVHMTVLYFTVCDKHCRQNNSEIMYECNEAGT